MPKRDYTIDILRGMAIFTMIAANMAAHSLMKPHPFIFRLYGSFAAPTFIFLSGMMVSHTVIFKLHPLNYYLMRGFATIIVAALIDFFLWSVIPFSTFDVLYLIGLSMPLIHLFLSAKKWFQIVIIFLLFSLTPILQFYLGYDGTTKEPKLIADFDLATTLHQFFIDGWFPIFPWLGVSLLGAFLGTFRAKQSPDNIGKLFLRLGFLFCVSGITVWYFAQPTFLVRDGYSELFYPPTLYYLFTFLGLILILLSLLQRVHHYKLFYFFSTYGKSSLLIYILHTVFIVAVFNAFFESYGLVLFILMYLSHAALLWLISFFVQKIKKQDLPFIIRFILGS